MVYILLADGFEEIEALAVADILRRAGVPAMLTGVRDIDVIGSHDICVEADITISEVDFDDVDAVILPGGMPGTENLAKSKAVCDMVKDTFSKQKLVCAICAAPLVLGRLDILRGKKATCFPGFENELKGAEISIDKVCKDGNVITSKGPGTAHDFAFEIVKALKGQEVAEKVKSSMQYE